MTGSNFGLRIEELRRVSPTVQSLQAHTAPAALDMIKIRPRGYKFKLLLDQIKNPIIDRMTTALADRLTQPFGDRITHPIADRFTDSLGDNRTDPIKDIRKLTAYDKQHSDDLRIGRSLGQGFGPMIGQGSLPLVLATPHHAPGAESSAAIDDAEMVAALEDAIVQLATQLEGLIAEHAALVDSVQVDEQ